MPVPDNLEKGAGCFFAGQARVDERPYHGAMRYLLVLAGLLVAAWAVHTFVLDREDTANEQNPDAPPGYRKHVAVIDPFAGDRAAAEALEASAEGTYFGQVIVEDNDKGRITTNVTLELRAENGFRLTTQRAWNSGRDGKVLSGKWHLRGDHCRLTYTHVNGEPMKERLSVKNPYETDKITFPDVPGAGSVVLRRTKILNVR